MIRLLDTGQDSRIGIFTTERGDCGEGKDAYAAFNCCGYTGDDPAHVVSCRHSLCEALGVADEHLLLPRQVHGTEIRYVGRQFLELPLSERETAFEGVDGIVTDVPQVAVGVFTADCVPIMLYDAVRGVVAAVHAGWRGTVAGIVRHAVRVMADCGAVPAELQVVFGPSICEDCFEVGEDVAGQFAAAGFPLDCICSRPHAGAKPHINLEKANAWLLESCGVKPGAMRSVRACTRCQPARYFSARCLGVHSGRIVTGILLCRPSGR